MEFTRASQVATVMLFHSSMTTSQTLRLCTPPLFAKMFYWVHVRRHAWPALLSASSVKQWSSWRCVWSHCHAGTLSCGPVSEGRGLYSTAVFHSTCWSSYFPQWNVTLQHLLHSCSPRPWHSHHHAWLLAWHTYLCTPPLVATTHAWSHQNQTN